MNLILLKGNILFLGLENDIGLSGSTKSRIDRKVKEKNYVNTSDVRLV